MRKEEKIKVGISIGDLNGIGGEIILKTLEDNRILELCTPIIFASSKVISFLKNHFKMKRTIPLLFLLQIMADYMELPTNIH